MSYQELTFCNTPEQSNEVAEKQIVKVPSMINIEI
jgi:hypothetical protein